MAASTSADLATTASTSANLAMTASTSTVLDMTASISADLAMTSLVSQFADEPSRPGSTKQDIPDEMCQTASSSLRTECDSTKTIQNESVKNKQRKLPEDEFLLSSINFGHLNQVVCVLKSENAFTQDGLNQALISACRRGHKLLVQTLVRVGANIEHQDEHGNTPLLICAGNGFTDIIRFLVSRHADVNAVNSVGNTALILSVRSAGSTDLTKFLLAQKGVDIDHKNYIGCTALARAKDVMDVDTVILLLTEIRRRNIHISVGVMKEQSVKQTGFQLVFDILQASIYSHKSPIELAIERQDTESLQILLNSLYTSSDTKKQQIDFTFSNVFKQNHKSRLSTLTASEIKTIQILLEHGAAVGGSSEHLPISIAVEVGNVQLVELLLNHGAYSDNNICFDINHPLSIAARKGQLDLINLLLKYNSKTDDCKFGESPLYYALIYGRIACAKVLIQRAAKMDVRQALTAVVDHRVPKSMHFLFENYKHEIMDYFLEERYQASRLLILAIERGNCEIIGQILDAGIDVNEEVTSTELPLLASTTIEVVLFLIQRGADVNRVDRSTYNCETPLTRLLQTKHLGNPSTIEMCHVFLQHGASVNFKSQQGQTSLMLAVSQPCCVDMLQMLLENGANVNAIDNDENTILHNLLMKSPRDCGRLLNILIKAGSDVNVQNINGLSPLMVAASKSMTFEISKLLDAGADINAVSKKDNSQTALSIISNSGYFGRDTLSSVETLLDRGASSSGLNPQFLFKCIKQRETKIILKLIQNGLGPSDINPWESSGSFPYTLVVSAVSPLMAALLVGHVPLARYFVDILFLTRSDLSMFASNKAMRSLFMFTTQENKLEFLKEISFQPMSLIKLSLVTVSAAVGSSPGRETRVDSLPLPQMMKDKLLFKSAENRQMAQCILSSESMSSSSSSSSSALRLPRQ